MEKIDKGLNWLEKGLAIVEKYKFKTIFKAVIYVLIIAGLVGFIKNPTWVFDKYDEWKKKQHDTEMDIRHQNSEKINNLCKNLLYKTGADRVMILELHNGNTGEGGLPFSKMTATYEQIEHNTMPIAHEYQGTTLSLMPFVIQLMRQGYWCGNISEIDGIDRSFYYRLKSNNIEHMASCIIEGVDKPLGILVVSYDELPENHNCVETRENIRHCALEFALLLELNQRIN